MIDWSQLALPGAILLIVPVAIIVGFRHATGAILIAGAVATVNFAAFWLVLGGISEPGSGSDPGFPVRIVMLYGGVLLTLAAWALALNVAAQGRRWLWVAALVVSGYLTLAAIYASFSLQNCFNSPDGEFTCLTPDPLRQALIIAGYLACPVAALVFGVGVPPRRGRALPDGLVVSSLHTAHVAERGVEAGDASSYEPGYEQGAEQGAEGL